MPLRATLSGNPLPPAIKVFLFETILVHPALSNKWKTSRSAGDEPQFRSLIWKLQFGFHKSAGAVGEAVPALSSQSSPEDADQRT